MKKALSILLSGLMLSASLTAVAPVSANASEPVLIAAPISANVSENEYSYNEYSNTVIVNAGTDVVLNDADAIVSLAKEKGTSSVTVTSLGKPTLTLKITDAALTKLDAAELSIKVALDGADFIMNSDVIAEISQKTGTEFELALDSTNGIKVVIKCDSASVLLDNAAVAVCTSETSDINNVVSNDTSVGLSYINGNTWYISVKSDVDAKAVFTKAPEFTDVFSNYWGKEYIEFVTMKGYFNGVEPGKFKPESRMTRGMVVTVLSRIDAAVDKELTYSYTDVDKNAWFAKGVNWAYENAIVAEGDTFRPDDDVTRLELIEMLYNFALKLGAASVDSSANEITFIDEDKLTDELSKKAVEFCTKNGIVNGYSIGDGSTQRLRPEGQATRAEVATMIKRFMDHVSAGEFEMTKATSKYSDFITVRSDLTNLYNKLNSKEEVVVSYFGGSVTAGYGSTNANNLSWRGLTYNWLKEKFPNAKLVQNSVAQGGSGSHLGAFRVGPDIIDMKSDLVFVEFAINDYYSGTQNSGTVSLYYEAILRQIREALPECEIIAIYVTDSGKVQSYGEYKMHETAAAQDAVCEHYGVTSIDVGRAISREMGGYNGAVWGTYFKDGVHPLDAGYKVFADAVIEYLGEYLLGESALAYGESKPHTVPADYADARSEGFTLEYVPINTLEMFDSIKGYTLVENGVFQDCTKTRGFIYPSEEDNQFTYTFEGTGLDIYLEFAGGKYWIEYSVDGGEVQKKFISDTNHPFRFLSGLEQGKHTVTYSYKGENGDGGVSSSRKLGAFMISGTK